MAHSSTAVRRPGYDAKGTKHFGYHAAAVISGTETVTIHTTYIHKENTGKKQVFRFPR